MLHEATLVTASLLDTGMQSSSLFIYNFALIFSGSNEMGDFLLRHPSKI